MRDSLRRSVVRLFRLGGMLVLSALPAGCGREDTSGAVPIDAAGSGDARQADAAVDASRPDASRPDAARPDAASLPVAPGAPDAGRWVLRLADGPVQDPLTLILTDVHVDEAGHAEIGRLVVEISAFSETLAERVVIAADGSITLDREALLTPWGAMDVHLEGSFMGPRFLCGILRLDAPGFGLSDAVPYPFGARPETGSMPLLPSCEGIVCGGAPWSQRECSLACNPGACPGGLYCDASRVVGTELSPPLCWPGDDCVGLPEACGEQSSCLVVDFASVCQSAGTAEQTESCATDPRGEGSRCRAGLICFGGVCERFCDPSDDALCPGCTRREVSGVALDVCLLPCGEGTPRPCEFDRPCHADSECESGRCVRPLSSPGVGRGYCSQTCEVAEDCTPSPDPGRPAYTCVPVGDEHLCIRTCRGSDECPAANVCAGPTGLEPESGPGVCVDLTDDLCGRDADCAADEYCVLHLDEHRALSYCSGFVDDAGRPVERARVGTPCEPRREWPCDGAADCPPAWDCAPLGDDGPSGCRPPPESECALDCLPEGRCTGLCEVDADCPAGMRCSMVGHPGLLEERPVYRACVHATGSEAPCRGAADCAATGPGGTAEDCAPIADAEGNVTPRCVTRTENFVAAGDACGDDPHTAEVEFRACHGACVGDCASFCVSEQDCPAGHACSGDRMTYIPLGAYCLPNTACFADGDCGEGEVCSFLFWEFGSENWWSTCAEVRGPLLPGAECPAAPMAFVPVEQRCGWRCADVGWGPEAPRCLSRCRFDADCPEDFLCAQRSYERYVGPRRRTEYFGFCEYAPGSRQPCGVTRDCPDGEVCLSSREVTPDGEPQDRSVCTTSIPGGAAIGEPCAPDRPCAGRACQSEGYCGALCGADGDCPAPMVCGWDASGNAGWFCRWPEVSPD